MDHVAFLLVVVAAAAVPGVGIVDPKDQGVDHLVLAAVEDTLGVAAAGVAHHYRRGFAAVHTVAAAGGPHWGSFHEHPVEVVAADYSAGSRVVPMCFESAVLAVPDPVPGEDKEGSLLAAEEAVALHMDSLEEVLRIHHHTAAEDIHLSVVAVVVLLVPVVLVEEELHTVRVNNYCSMFYHPQRRICSHLQSLSWPFPTFHCSLC